MKSEVLTVFGNIRTVLVRPPRPCAVRRGRPAADAPAASALDDASCIKRLDTNQSEPARATAIEVPWRP